MADTAATHSELALLQQKISGRWPLENLLSFVTSLSARDVLIEQEMKRRQKWIFISLPVILLFVFIAGKANERLHSPLLFILIVSTPVALLLFNLSRYLALKKRDMSNEFREYVGPLIRDLSDDIKEESLVTFDIDFSQIENRKNHKGRSEKYSKGNYYECYDDRYERPLMTLILRLQDRNTLAIKCWEDLVKLSRKKKSSRNRIKTKEILKRKMHFEIRLYVNKEHYACNVSGNDTSGVLKLRESAKGPVIGIKYKERLVGAASYPSPLLTLKNIMVLYTHLSPHTSPAG